MSKKEINILIVDDEEKIANIIAKYLRLYNGFNNIIIANDGVQAVQKISNQDFDLVITDLVMPKRDGLILIDNIQKVPKYNNLKFMVVSGCLNKEMTIATMKRVVKHIVVKPFSARQILEKTFEALKIDKRPKVLADKIILKVSEMLIKRKDLLESATAEIPVNELFDISKSGKE